jgi:ATP-binding protein involved in chromosome partitioning
MSDIKTQVLTELKRVRGPNLDGNIVDLGLVSEVLIKDDKVYFSITVPAHKANDLEPMRQAAEKVVADIAGVKGVTAVLTADIGSGGYVPSPRPAEVTTPTAKPQEPVKSATDPSAAGKEHPRVQAARQSGGAGDGGSPKPPVAVPATAPQPKGMSGPIAVTGVKHLIAVASGKGGVGKSTVAVNLALGLQSLGLKVGVMDADIYGPSQPKLLGLTARPDPGEGRKMKPLMAHGLQSMSMGYLVEEDTPVVWRGPMVAQALNQMLREVTWSDLDVLIIDMPPGTGDVQLSMAQQVPLAGAVIVSTPQDLALIDARKGLGMFRKVNVPVLGIVENMSYYLCPKCGDRADIFGHGGARAEAAKLKVPFLGEVPLHMDIRTNSDAGTPVTIKDPNGAHAKIFRDIAASVWGELQQSVGKGMKPPKLELGDNSESLIVTFANGDVCDLPAEFLRVLSPSAEVQGHSKEQRVTVGGKRGIKISDLRPVGNYAVRIVFADGHDTGLFTWSYLHMLGLQKTKKWNEYLAELEAKGLSRG